MECEYIIAIVSCHAHEGLDGHAHHSRDLNFRKALVVLLKFNTVRISPGLFVGSTMSFSTHHEQRLQ